MSRFFRMLPKVFVNAFQNLIRHFAMLFSSSSAVGITLFIISIFMLIAGNVQMFTENIENDFKIHTSIDEAEKVEITDLQKEIEALPGVKNVEFSSKEEEFALFLNSSDRRQRYYEEQENPMPDAFIIETETAQDIETVRQKLSEIKGLSNPQYGGDGVLVMVQTFETLRYGMFIFIVGLVALSLFLIHNTIKMTIITRKTEIAIMRSVGASNWYIRTPFIIEGIMIGIIGAIVPIAFTYFGYNIIYRILDGQLFSSMFILREVYPFTLYISIVLLGIAILVGIIGSYLAVSKYLRWKR